MQEARARIIRDEKSPNGVRESERELSENFFRFCATFLLLLIHDDECTERARGEMKKVSGLGPGKLD